MPNVRLLCIGRIKENYLQEAQAEYAKRLSAFCRLEIVERKESALPVSPSAALIGKACAQESEALLGAASGTLIALSQIGRASCRERV